MNDEPKYRNIEDQHIHGLGVQYLIASKNRLILKELKRIQPNLKEETPQYLKDLFLYLADTAKRDTILSLSKIYDRPSKRNKVRSSIELLNQLKPYSKELFTTINLIENSWIHFLENHSNIIGIYPELKTDKENLINVIEEKINSLQESGKAIYKLKIWRDKFLAHNERYNNEISLTEEEIEVLFGIAYLVFDLYNSFLNKGYVKLESPNISFVNEVFKVYLE